MPSNTLDRDSMLTAEYGTLRTEILQRISTRYTIINFALVLFAAALGFQKAPLILLYPVIACFLLGMYDSNQGTINEITCYIKTRIEQPVKNQSPPKSETPNGGAKNEQARTQVQMHNGQAGTQSQTEYDGWQHFKDTLTKNSFVHRWGRWVFVVTELGTFLVAFGVQSPDFSHFTVLDGEYIAAIFFIGVTVRLAYSKDRFLQRSSTANT